MGDDVVGLGTVEVDPVGVGVGQRQDDLRAVGAGTRRAPFRNLDLRLTGRNGFGQERALPALLAGRRLEDVEHLVLPTGVGHSGLDFFGQALGQDFDPQLLEGVIALRQDLEHQVDVETGQQRRQRQDRTVEREQANTGSADRDQLAVGRHTPDGDQDGEEERHRDRQHHDVGQRQEQQPADGLEADVAADEELRRSEEDLQQENEGVDQEPEEERSDDLCQEVAVEAAYHRPLIIADPWAGSVSDL